MHDKPAVTQHPIHDIIARRWSPRAYDVNKRVSRAQLISLLEAARWAPSCYGDEPWRFIVWDRNHDAAAFQRAFDCLGEFNQGWVKNAPVLMLVLASEHFRKGAPNRWGMFDAGAAAENVYLQAVALGLAAHPMGGFDAEEVKRAFNVPDGYTPMAMIAVGHQADAAVLDGDLHDSEIALRQRRPLGENFFEGEWGRPVVPSGL
ncbi:nitroreductase family protein [Methylococcus capsulatus]|jgi:nitroreductase|uniref:Nitroreductase family protein n=1 Tax=Methylococcus capsulatus TaxID=414 RepID=A0AA35V6W4_METCP|nr:nitroreductase family protein [Methylococcus capsulatus]CAI8842022.1 putative nitroreductase family protein [Methylococcus capsulatus]